MEAGCAGSVTVRGDVGHLLDLPCQIFQPVAMFRIKYPASTKGALKCTAILEMLH